MSLPPTTEVAFLDSLADAVPAVGAVIRQARGDNDGLALVSVEMAEATRWFLDTFRGQPESRGADRAQPAIGSFLWILEASFQTGDEAIDSLIATSFLENLHQADDDLPEVLAALPPKLRAWYRQGFGE